MRGCVGGGWVVVGGRVTSHVYGHGVCNNSPIRLRRKYQLRKGWGDLPVTTGPCEDEVALARDPGLNYNLGQNWHVCQAPATFPVVDVHVAWGALSPGVTGTCFLASAPWSLCDSPTLSSLVCGSSSLGVFWVLRGPSRATHSPSLAAQAEPPAPSRGHLLCSHPACPSRIRDPPAAPAMGAGCLAPQVLECRRPSEREGLGPGWRGACPHPPSPGQPWEGSGPSGRCREGCQRCLSAAGAVRSTTTPSMNHPPRSTGESATGSAQTPR